MINKVSVIDRLPPMSAMLSTVVTAGSVAFWLIIIWHLYSQSMTRARYGILFMGSILILYVVNELAEDSDSRGDILLLVGCAAILFANTYHFYTDFNTVYTIRSGWALDYEYGLAAGLVGTILYLTWREFGRIFVTLLAGTIIYARFGYFVPGFFGHGGVRNEFILRTLVTDVGGFYGSITQITAAWIAPFLLFGGLLLAYGAFDLILRLAIRSSRYIRSGVAQTAVISSAIIGSINGSYAANAGMTGSITIPTMKDSGISGKNSAGIEAVASTSGQVLPPVMGAAAFVMASFLGIQYVDVLVAGILPAAVFVCCIIIGVHYTALRDTGEQTLEFDEFFEESLSVTEKVAEGLRFGVPLIVLIYFLGIAQYTVMSAALITVITMIIIGILTPIIKSVHHAAAGNKSWFEDLDSEPSSSTGQALAQLPSFVRRLLLFSPVYALGLGIRETIDGFEQGATILAPIAIIIVAINGVVDLFMTTGIPSALALAMIELSGGYLIIAVTLAMIISIISGVGMPTVAAYVVVSILVAPTLVSDFGIPEITAHYTVFYATILAGITPPVAPAAIITSGIAKADFWRTCETALRIAAPLFVLPISFVYHPEIVSVTIVSGDIASAAIILAGGVAIIIGLNYPFAVSRNKRYPLRTGIMVCGIVTMIHPSLIIQLLSAVVAGGLFFVNQFFVQRTGASLAGAD